MRMKYIDSLYGYDTSASPHKHGMLVPYVAISKPKLRVG